MRVDTATINFRDENGKFCSAGQWFSKPRGIYYDFSDHLQLAEKSYEKLVADKDRILSVAALAIFGGVKLETRNNPDAVKITIYENGRILVTSPKNDNATYGSQTQSERANILREFIAGVEYLTEKQHEIVKLAHATSVNIPGDLII